MVVGDATLLGSIDFMLPSKAGLFTTAGRVTANYIVLTLS